MTERARLIEAVQRSTKLDTLLQCVATLEGRDELSAALILLDILMHLETEELSREAYDPTDDMEPLRDILRENREGHRNRLAKLIAERDRNA